MRYTGGGSPRHSPKTKYAHGTASGARCGPAGMRAGARTENGQLYSYAFFFHRGNIFFLDCLAHAARRARQGPAAAHFRACCSSRLAPAMLMGEVEVPDGGSHDGLRLRRMHFYARHGFELGSR